MNATSAALLGTLTALLGSAVTLLCAWLMARSQQHQTERETEATLETHTQELALGLLKAAREERADMQAEVDRWKSLATHLDDFDMALAHIEALLSAEAGMQRAAIERSAHAFLERINLKRKTTHTVRAAAQLAASAARMEDRMP